MLVTVEFAALLLAIKVRESLVEVSPSTVMRLKDPSARSLTKPAIKPGAMQASVAIKPSMVAMFGRIMPAPLAMPVTVIVADPRLICLLKALATVSVVMMPVAALSQLSVWASAIAAGRPAKIRSTGKVSMITPVEYGNTWLGVSPNAVAAAEQV